MASRVPPVDPPRPSPGSAWFTFDDEDLGSIEVGKLADLVVLSDDYLTVPDEEIRTLSSVLTLIGGKVVYANAEFASLVTAVEDRPEVPETPRLIESYPNPFRSTITIQFNLSDAGYIRLTVYDTLGRQVERVADGRYGVGTHAVIFNGSSLPAGLYIYRLEMPDGRFLTGKIVHLE